MDTDEHGFRNDIEQEITERTEGDIHHRVTEARSQPRKLSGQVCAWSLCGKWSVGVMEFCGDTGWRIGRKRTQRTQRGTKRGI